MDELSQLDELIESDILEALGENTPKTTLDEEEINLEDFQELEESSPLVEQEEISIENLDEETNSSPEINIEDMEPINEQINDLPNQDTNDIKKIDTNINTVDLASLISQLLTNKTIEITIKIKD